MSQRVPPRPGASRLDPDAEWLAASEGAARGGARRPGGFDQAVYALVRRIPAGRVMTYGQVAARVGVARGARAVGGAMRRCPPGVPWHRVVNGGGAVSRRANPSRMLTQRLLLRRGGRGGGPRAAG